MSGSVGFVAGSVSRTKGLQLSGGSLKHLKVTLPSTRGVKSSDAMILRALYTRPLSDLTDRADEVPSAGVDFTDVNVFCLWTLVGSEACL